MNYRIYDSILIVISNVLAHYKHFKFIRSIILHETLLFLFTFTLISNTEQVKSMFDYSIIFFAIILLLAKALLVSLKKGA